MQRLLSEQIPRSWRYETLDILRGLACLAIVIHHAAGTERVLDCFPLLPPRLWLGVSAFFAISGYCIAASCDSARRHERSFRWFMWRRARRIFPPYWIALFIVVFAYYAGGVSLMGELQKPDRLTVVGWIGNLTLTATWLSTVFGGVSFFVLPIAWTLWYEEQFYLICGLLLLVARSRFFVGVIAISIGCVPFTIMHWTGMLNLHNFFIDGYWFQFAAGIFAYYGCNYTSTRGRFFCFGSLMFATALMVALRMTLPRVLVNDLSRVGFFDACACAFILASLMLILKPWDATIASAPFIRPFKLVGIRCYSLYLVHLPVINMIRLVGDQMGTNDRTRLGIGEAVFTVVACIVASALFYELAERRFLNSPGSSPHL